MSILAKTLLLAACLAPVAAHAEDILVLKRLWTRLSGMVPSAADVAAIQGKSKDDVAALATNTDGFYNTTVKHLFCPMSNRSEIFLLPRTPVGGASAGQGCLNDFVATGIGVAKDDLSAKLLLTGDFIYRADPAKYPAISHADADLYETNRHYEDLERANVNLRDALIQSHQMFYSTTDTTASPQPLPDTAGLLTTHQFAQEHMIMGTNRRVFEYTSREFMCHEINELRDSNFLNDPVKITYIRRDVDKTNRDFLSTCITCHGGLDRVSTAFAYFDFQKNTVMNVEHDRLIYTGALSTPVVQTKMNPVITNQNQGGYIVPDDEWENFFTENRNADLGWRGATRGKGIHAFGEMISNTKAFSACMAKRVFTEVCKRPPLTSEAGLIKGLAEKFEANGYKIRGLFRDAAVVPNCISN